MSDDALRIAVVGGGPWGVYAAERLLAHHRERPRGRLEVMIVEARPPVGPGPNFALDLPDHAILNVPADHVDPWTDCRPTVLPPELRDLTSWLRSRGRDPGPGTPVPRSWAGEYFRDAARWLLEPRWETASVTVAEGRVEDLSPREAGWRVALGAGAALDADHVLLATGMPEADPSGDAERDFARRHGLVRISAGDGASGLAAVLAGRPVALRGMGISFMDVLLDLTEGRGGRFRDTGRGLRYEPSGNEPRPFVPFSRSGLLPSPKPAGPWPHFDRYPVRASTRERLRLLAGGPPLDWARDVWPMVDAEMRHALRLAGPTPEEEAAFDPADALVPLDPVHRTSGERLLEASLARLRGELEAARGGPGHATMTAFETWGRLFPVLAPALGFGGLTAPSQRDLERHTLPAWDRRVFGPPPLNAHKLLALLRDGWLDLRWAAGGTVELSDAAGQFRLEAPSMADPPVELTGLVDARHPAFDVRSGAPPLYRCLLDRGVLTQFVNRGGGSYASGGVAVDRYQRALDGDGRPVPGLAVVGAPTEGCVFGTDSLPGTRFPWADVWARHVLE